MKSGNPFSSTKTADLIKSARENSKAQERLAAVTNEDLTHWHHFALSHLLNELASRLENNEKIIEHHDKET